MRLSLPTLLLLAAETATAFVPTPNPSCSLAATYAPLFSSEQDTVGDTSARTTGPASDAEKEIDWDGLFSAASAFGGAFAKGVEAAAPVVAGAAVDAAFDIKGVATAAVTDLQKLNEQAAKRGGQKISFGWKSAVDVSIPYDAACRIAYEDWKAKFDKTQPQEDDLLSAEERFQQFRISYQRTTIANVAAKKKVRDAGGFEEARTLKTVELDQYADLTDLEYTDAIRTPSWGEILGDLADVATSVVSKSVPTTAKTPTPPKTKPVKITASKKFMAPKVPIKAATSIKPPTAKPSFSMFGGGKKEAPVQQKAAPAMNSRPKPFFGAMKTTTPATAISGKAAPTRKKVMTPKEAEFAKKIEASRAAKAKALAERKKKQEEQLRKTRENFRG